jgi:hypothetical protein
MSVLKDLKRAKQFSDAKQYSQKHNLIHDLVLKAPKEFYVDSEKDGIVGLTHSATNFKIHVPKNVIGNLELGQAPSKESAAATSIGAGFGMPNISGGGDGSYVKLPSLFGSMKADLTKATKQVGEKSKQQTPVGGTAAEKLYPATANYMRKKMSPTPFAYKNAALTSDLSRALGYSPGLWYNEGSFTPAAQTRFGNLVSGVGLTGLGLAAIPVLKYMFPERFRGKEKAMMALAALGGMSAPWLVNAPSTMADISRMSLPKNENYTEANKQKMQQDSRSRSGITPTGSNVLVAEGKGSTKRGSYIPMDMQIARTHLADVVSEQMRSGYVDYGQAAGLMLRASRESNKPWFTVRDLAHAAIGAGAGAVAGTAAAKGIGMFVNLKPNEQKLMQGTGAALGTLINLGKLSF